MFEVMLTSSLRQNLGPRIPYSRLRSAKSVVGLQQRRVRERSCRSQGLDYLSVGPQGSLDAILPLPSGRNEPLHRERAALGWENLSGQEGVACQERGVDATVAVGVG